MSPRAPPTRPTPDVRVAREVVARRAAWGRLEIRPADVHHALLIAIFRQQLGAETEERKGGQTIVFEDDGFGALLKHPIDPRRHAAFAAEIGVRKIRHYVAVPI